MIYFDNASNTKISSSVIDVMNEVFCGDYGNFSSIHSFGRNSATIIKNSTDLIGNALGCKSEELYFTSGATESNNWAVLIAKKAMQKSGKRHIITSQIEHKSVLSPLMDLKNEGFDITFVKPDKYGIISVQSVKDAIRNDTGFVSIMAVNNETGAIQPVSEIAEICKENKILFHTDAVQMIGNISVNLDKLGADMVTFCAHKLHGPTGIGALYLREELAEVPSLIKGGGQQRGKRSGTLSPALVAGFAKAVSESVSMIDEKHERLSEFSEIIINSVPKAKLNGGMNRIPSIINLSFENIFGESLVLLLDIKGVMVSSTSACSTGGESSHVITAMDGNASGSIRISMSRYTTRQEVETLIYSLNEAVDEINGLIST